MKLLLLPCAFLALTGCSTITQDVELISKPRILVVNDDGIQSPGIIELSKALSKIGEVVVCAPNGNRSGASHSSVAFSELLVVEDVSIPGASYACSISGTPADACSFAIIHLGKKKPFDLVVSGINRGSNVGKIAHYSGTVGAAMEANYHNIPSIATSQDSQLSSFKAAAGYTAKFASSLLKQSPSGDICWSLNFPNTPDGQWKGSKTAPMGGAYIEITGFRETQDGFKPRISFKGEYPEESDTSVYKDGWVSVTPLRFNWTEERLIREAQKWLPQM